MVKPDDSADEIVRKYHDLVKVRCKICKRKKGFAEHARMNMYVCKKCRVWYNRQLFAQRIPRTRVKKIIKEGQQK